VTKVVQIHRYGGPEGLSVDEVDVGAPGEGEVRIKVGAIGLNRFETIVLSGAFGQMPTPAKIGYEAAGKIDAVGKGVSGFAVGDRVAILPGLPPPYGAAGETILCPANLLVKSPDGQSDTDAAATWMQYLTAYAIRAFRPIGPGDAVLITAASSSVGLAAIQIAKADGGVPIAVTRGRGKAEALKKHGAAHVVASDEQDVAATVKEITEGRGAAIAFDAVGGAGFPAILGALGYGGMAIVYGGLGGEPSHFSSSFMSFMALTIRGYGTNQLVGDARLKDEAIAYIRSGLTSGKLRPVIDRTYPLSQIVDAYQHLLSNQQVGKIVVTV
jgi:NADPH:quinone reductase-like Zn-dependent oxidoreductase